LEMRWWVSGNPAGLFGPGKGIPKRKLNQTVRRVTDQNNARCGGKILGKQLNAAGTDNQGEQWDLKMSLIRPAMTDR